MVDDSSPRVAGDGVREAGRLAISSARAPRGLRRPSVHARNQETTRGSAWGEGNGKTGRARSMRAGQDHTTRIEASVCAVRFLVPWIGQSFGAAAGTSSIRIVFIHSAAMLSRSVIDIPA